MAEAAVLLLLDQAEAGLLVDLAGGHQDIVGPQHHGAVADRPREANTLLHQALADAQPAHLRLDQQQAQLGHRVRLLDAEDRANVLALPLGYLASVNIVLGSH